METAACVQRAIDFIEDNLLDDLKPDVIAAQAYMSAFAFQRLFAMVCGVTLGEYVRNRRMTLAGAEVVNTAAKLIDIAYRYGYETPESFSRAFARFHGQSPSAARSRGQAAALCRFDPISVQIRLGGKDIMQSLKQRGYNVQENGAIYYTNDMDRTAKWFEEALGWYVGIDERDAQGAGTYGCAMPVPGELKNMTLMRFNGFHLFRGEPVKQTVGFMQVDDVEAFRAFVVKSGWTKVGEIIEQPWGARECSVTTVDGGTIRVFALA